MRTKVSIWVAAFLAGACSGSPSSTAAPTSGAPATAAPPVTTAPLPTALVTPIPTNAAGIRTCVSSSEGPERPCALETGTYATAFFVPQVTYTVPSAGWASLNREAAPGNFHLFPPGGGGIEAFSDGTTDAISIVSAAVPPGRCTGEPSTELPATFDGLVGFLTTNDRLAVSNVRDASVGGLDGKAMDVAFKASDGCSDGDYADFFVGVAPSHGAFGINPVAAGARLYLLHVDGSDKALVIQVDDAKDGGSDYGDGAAWNAAADALIGSIHFGP